MTECTQQGFTFEGHFSRRGVAEFSGDRLTTDGGALLLREADRKIGLLRRVADCFSGHAAAGAGRATACRRCWRSASTTGAGPMKT